MYIFGDGSTWATHVAELNGEGHEEQEEEWELEEAEEEPEGEAEEGGGIISYRVRFLVQNIYLSHFVPKTDKRFS